MIRGNGGAYLHNAECRKIPVHVALLGWNVALQCSAAMMVVDALPLLGRGVLRRRAVVGRIQPFPRQRRRRIIVITEAAMVAPGPPRAWGMLVQCLMVCPRMRAELQNNG